MVENSEVKQYYNDYSSRQKNVGVNERHKSILKRLIDAGLTRSCHVLEIGCGIGTLSGLILKHLSAKGSLTAYDISDKSIDMAIQSYSKFKNARFLCADVIQTEIIGLFNLIVLPDVIEHIPIEKHSILFNKISAALAPNGFVFIHIPNPDYLEWCHTHRSDLLQIIDQPIFINKIIENTLPHGLMITKLETYSIWVTDGDYQYIILRKKGYEDYTKIIEPRITILDKIKYKLNAFRK